MLKTIFCQLNKHFLWLIVMTAFTSCKVAYFPTTHNSPIHSNKGEFQASGIIGSGNLELKTAYAITDNIGIMVNGSYFGEKKEISSGEDIPEEISEHRTLIEIGGGYFTKIGGSVILEVYGGGGIGTVPGDFRNVDYTYDGTQTASMSKIFLQPAIGLGSEMVDFSGVVRISAISINNETRFFAEPGLVMKVGYKNVRFVGNLGFSASLYNSKSFTWDHNPFIIGLGLQFSIGRKY